MLRRLGLPQCAEPCAARGRHRGSRVHQLDRLGGRRGLEPLDDHGGVLQGMRSLAGSDV